MPTDKCRSHTSSEKHFLAEEGEYNIKPQLIKWHRTA